MIELKGITKKYGEFTAVDNLSFKVTEGSICILIGPSGCGKSTTLKMINRMLEPTSGEILIDKKDIRVFRPEILRRQIGYVIQNIGLFPHMNVAQNIAVVPRLLHWDKKKIETRVNYLLELIELHPDKYREKFPHQLSGGEAQRIGVARALAADPPILLMDEPFGAVDPLNREILQIEFLKIQKKLKKTVIFVTHDLDEAIRLGDFIIILKKGNLVQFDTPENILSQPKNSFVRNFVGTDRALKRLSRFSVSNYMDRAERIILDSDSDYTFRDTFREYSGLVKKHFLWVTDKQDRLTGWIDAEALSSREAGGNLRNYYTEINPKDIAVGGEFTLKEALSRMLSQGVRVVPVIDDLNRLIGEISLSAIEKITEEAMDE
ncbi:MAG: ABC transporter ATP-binding protein [Spirochaetales bacterium]|nr:ABC transporter ATP-binding protein [Spirochaetales bacterium]